MKETSADCSLGFYKLFALIAGILAGLFLLVCCASSMMVCALQYKLDKVRRKLKKRRP